MYTHKTQFTDLSYRALIVATLTYERDFRKGTFFSSKNFLGEDAVLPYMCDRPINWGEGRAEG